jgi:hypothetical protein
MVHQPPHAWQGGGHLGCMCIQGGIILDLQEVGTAFQAWGHDCKAFGSLGMLGQVWGLNLLFPEGFPEATLFCLQPHIAPPPCMHMEALMACMHTCYKVTLDALGLAREGCSPHGGGLRLRLIQTLTLNPKP